MNVVITRDVPPRHRGFLASCMLEVTPGVYVSPHMTSGARERIWAILLAWEPLISGGSITMLWPAPKSSSGVGLKVMWVPPRSFIDHEGLWLTRMDLTPKEEGDLELYTICTKKHPEQNS